MTTFITPFDKIEDPPDLNELWKPLPKGAHILGEPYEPPEPFAPGGSARGSSRLNDILTCPLKWFLKQEFTTDLLIGNQDIIMGSLGHIVIPYYWMAREIREYGTREPNWFKVPLEERLRAVPGAQQKHIDSIQKIIKKAWPQILGSMPPRTLAQETEIAATLGELDPAGRMDGRMTEDESLEIVTAKVDHLAWLGFSQQTKLPVITVEDYKTRNWIGKEKVSDSLDFQAALYKRVIQARFKGHVESFVQVLVQRSEDEPAVDRRVMRTPPVLAHDLGAHLLEAIRTERKTLDEVVACQVQTGKLHRPLALGMSRGVCYGTAARWPCEFVGACCAPTNAHRRSFVRQIRLRRGS